VSYLQMLRSAQTRLDVARILGFEPRSLSYILYKMPDVRKYTSFEIPKRSGGMRQIKAPADQLRLLQRRLANALYLCLDEIERSGAGRRSLAHGFERKRSIVTNASIHKRRRYVLNLDLAEFFPSINFGRVRGFFIKDKHFALNEKVATVIAQVACHDNELPQGSPCSPVISNLVCHLLDVRLARFAKEHKCTYSRYADDITFSTNRRDFPTELAASDSKMPSRWHLGAPLVAEIKGSGFHINENKTRMQCRGSRQVATGLLVNEKVNIRPEYYRIARSMCHGLFSTGEYYRMTPTSLVAGSTRDTSIKIPATSLDPLEGILAHIHYVKSSTPPPRDADRNKPTAAEALYRKFLFYKAFVALKAPLIVPEGKTDSIYLRAAMKKLTSYHPILGQISNGIFSTNIRLIQFTDTISNILRLGNGSGGLSRLIYDYKRTLKIFRHCPIDFPVIIIIDNDDGAKSVFKAANAARESTDASITHSSKAAFYHLGANLYLVKTPEEIASGQESCIEDLFDPEILKTVVEGKTFDPHKEHNAKGKYGKAIFAEKVIKPSIDTIDFSRFGLLLDRVVAVLRDYETRRSAPP